MDMSYNTVVGLHQTHKTLSTRLNQEPERESHTHSELNCDNEDHSNIYEGLFISHPGTSTDEAVAGTGSNTGKQYVGDQLMTLEADNPHRALSADMETGEEVYEAGENVPISYAQPWAVADRSLCGTEHSSANSILPKEQNVTSMSRTDSSMDSPETTNKQMAFVKLLKGHSVLLSKSQRPKIKERKATALRQVIAEYRDITGIELNDKQLTKKINNMKNDVKFKLDMKKNGDRPPVLKDWEKVLLQLIQAEKNNALASSGSSLSGGPQMGPKRKRPEPSETLVQGSQQVTDSAQPAIIPRPAKKIRLPNETEETANLSMRQLKRLVLLEQLKLIRMQQRQIVTLNGES